MLTSASASTQTTILPTARTTLSMARWDAIPVAFGRVHPRFFTPTFSTLLMGALSIVWTVALLAFNPNQDVLGDTISALGFAVCFYYGFTGLACAVYFRRDLFKSARNFFFAGLVPVRRRDHDGLRRRSRRTATTTPRGTTTRSRSSASRRRSSSVSAA